MKVSYMDLEEFIHLGFLQEGNRLFFHPRGVALEMRSGWTAAGLAEKMGTNRGDHEWDFDQEALVDSVLRFLKLDRFHLSGVWDSREDEEGIYFGGGLDEERAERVEHERRKHLMTRIRMFKVSEVQPVDWKPPES